jgi:subtilisin family serine protease
MRYRRGYASLVLAILSLIYITCLTASPVHSAGDSVKVDAGLQALINQNESTGYVIHFKAKPNLSRAYTMDWKSRGEFVVKNLQHAANTSQTSVKAYLNSRNAQYRDFWIGNMIIVEKSDLSTFNGLKGFSEIDRIGQRPKIILYEPVERGTDGSQTMAVEPNLSHVKADQVWALGYTGTGITVANIDTGVRYTHQALVNQYRGNSGGGIFDHSYNWWDPYSEHTTPADDNGHGTHTMGTMVGYDGGSNRIGMAPGAKWIACRGCSTSDCSDAALLECAQFVAAPWDSNKQNADPSKRPHVVNNSWGDCGTSYDNWYRAVVDNWHAAGIYPVFSNGNASNCSYQEPPGCNTVGNPGRYGNVTGVGSSGRDDGQYASHSNWGPTDNPDTVNPAGYPNIKPQIVAPGVNIRSSVNTGDTAYQGGWTGTSMSAPHVTGLIALMYGACSAVSRQYGSVETILQNTAIAIPYASGCGGEGPGNVPNNATGWGEIDALAAVMQAVSVCGPTGNLTGKVLSSKDQKPVPNATITINALSVVTNDQGEYALSYIPVGQYTPIASAYGFYDQEQTVNITRDVTATADFTLKPKPLVTLSGKVTDGSGAKWPLYGTLLFSTQDVTRTAVTKPTNGSYSVKLYKDTLYDVAVSSFGYTTTEITMTTSGRFSPRNFSLTVDPGCFAPGYSSSSGSCVAQSGGLVTGTLKDANTRAPLSGMVVANGSGDTTTTDSNGKYIIFSPTGSGVITGNPSGLANYGPVSKTVNMTQGRVLTSDLSLPAAMFKGPKSINITVVQDQTKKATLRLQNGGGVSTPFTLIDLPVNATAGTSAGPVKVALAPSDYKAPPNGEPASAGRAPQAGVPSSGSPAAAMYKLVGYPAFAVNASDDQLVTFNTDTPGIWNALGSVASGFYAGDFLNGDFSKLYAINYDDSTLYTIDTGTAAATPIGTAASYGGESWTGMTSSVDGTLYAASTSISRSTLYTVDPFTGGTAAIGEITNAPGIIGIAMNASGDMYGVDIVNDVLVKINPATAAGQVIGSIGFNANYAQGLSFEKLSGILYYAAYNNDEARGELRVVDTSTGNTTLVGPFPGGAEVDCLAFATAVDVSWLSENPITGTVGAKKTQTITVTFDATGLDPGTYKAEIRATGNTPYDPLSIPVTMKVAAKKRSAPSGKAGEEKD